LDATSTSETKTTSVLKSATKPNFDLGTTTAPSALLGRLQNFLPLIKQANENLIHNTDQKECVEIVDCEEEEKDEKKKKASIVMMKDEDDEEMMEDDDEYDEEDTSPYVEMNVALGVLEERKRPQSLIREVSDNGEVVHPQQDGAQDDHVPLRLTTEKTPLELKQEEEDLIAYMKLVSSLIGNQVGSDSEENDEED